MGSPRYSTKDIQPVLTMLVAKDPGRRDRRDARGLAPRYVEHGQPNCLVAALLHSMGISLGVLKQLDREAGSLGGGIILRMTEHAIRRRFTPPAWELLDYLQRQNDHGATWGAALESAFGSLERDYWIVPPKEHRSWMLELQEAES